MVSWQSLSLRRTVYVCPGMAVWAYPGTEVSTQNVSRSHLILLDELLLDLVLGPSLFLPRLSGLTSLTSAAFCWKIICQAFSRAGGECKILQGKFRAASCSAKFGLTSSRLSSESSLFKSWNVISLLLRNTPLQRQTKLWNWLNIEFLPFLVE